jgi:hypothetical protein
MLTISVTLPQLRQLEVGNCSRLLYVQCLYISEYTNRNERNKYRFFVFIILKNQIHFISHFSKIGAVVTAKSWPNFEHYTGILQEFGIRKEPSENNELV